MPYVVLEDADLEATVKTCVASRLINAGQSCIAAKRFIVVDSIRQRFEAAFVAQMRTAKVGDPMDEQTQVGPLARHDLRDDLHQQVRGAWPRALPACWGRDPGEHRRLLPTHRAHPGQERHAGLR